MTRHTPSHDDTSEHDPPLAQVGSHDLPDDLRAVQVHRRPVPDDVRTVQVHRTPDPSTRMTVDEYVKAKLAEAPPLTQAQRDRIATLLWSGS